MVIVAQVFLLNINHKTVHCSVKLVFLVYLSTHPRGIPARGKSLSTYNMYNNFSRAIMYTIEVSNFIVLYNIQKYKIRYLFD